MFFVLVQYDDKRRQIKERKRNEVIGERQKYFVQNQNTIDGWYQAVVLDVGKKEEMEKQLQLLEGGSSKSNLNPEEMLSDSPRSPSPEKLVTDSPRSPNPKELITDASRNPSDSQDVTYSSQSLLSVKAKVSQSKLTQKRICDVKNLHQEWESTESESESGSKGDSNKSTTEVTTIPVKKNTGNIKRNIAYYVKNLWQK